MEDLQQVHKIEYSVVIPVFNGENSIKELCEELILYFKQTAFTYEIIFIDDKSVDNSWTLIKALKKQYPQIVIGIRLSKNFGQHKATCSGFKRAKGNYIITIDDDLEVLPSQIQLLIDTQQQTQADVVYGNYINVERSLIRKCSKNIYKFIAKIIGEKNSVEGSSFRLISSVLAKKIEQKATFFIFIDEVILWYTNKISYVPVTHSKSRRIKSNYSYFGLVKIAIEVMSLSSIFPLKLIKYLGLTCSSINFLIGIYYLYRKIFYGFKFSGYASIIVSLLFSTGLIIFILGVLGEYLSKMFYLMNNRPIYLIDEEI